MDNLSGLEKYKKYLIEGFNYEREIDEVVESENGLYITFYILIKTYDIYHFQYFFHKHNDFIYKEINWVILRIISDPNISKNRNFFDFILKNVDFSDIVINDFVMRFSVNDSYYLDNLLSLPNKKLNINDVLDSYVFAYNDIVDIVKHYPYIYENLDSSRLTTDILDYYTNCSVLLKVIYKTNVDMQNTCSKLL